MTSVLFGPNGLPLTSTSNHKKAEQPPLGPAFGAWSGRDVHQAQMPGGALLQFDLSSLTMEDYRAMRYHPTLNSALSVLTFMLHQIDWHIECEDKRIQNFVEENMREIWTRLIRAMSTAFWAGYSPNALEYKNDPISGRTKIDKIKDLLPESCEVHWKEVEGSYAPPGKMKPKFYVYDGIDQWGMPFPIPPDNTLWYPVLMENGDMYGRKLLKSAFMPWYFSLLVHLFANRYFERFGEPTVYGRAPFDEDVTMQDGTIKSGKEVMEQIIMNLRNRSSVVLPAERDPAVTSAGANKAYLWELDYLESQMRGADFERYLARLDEEMTLALFTPLLLLRNAGEGSHNLGVQHTQCVEPDARVLCADLTWRRAGDLKPGDEIVSFDEDAAPGGRGVNSRCYRTGVVEWNIPSTKPSMRVTTDIGNPMTASVDHPWLVWRKRTKGEHGTTNPGLVWVETQDLEPGDQIAYFGQPWEREETHDAGWLAGMFDGEGTLAVNTSNHGHEGRGIELSISQNEGVVLDRLKQLLTDRGFTFSDAKPAPTGHGKGNCHKLRISGGFMEAVRLVGTLGPTRFLEKANVMWEGRGLRKGMSYTLAVVESVVDVGDHPVASIQVSNGTFIAEGYLVHNTWLWMLNALAGDLKEYIDRYITNRLKAINFSPLAPNCQWVPRKMGKESVETIRAIVTTLLREGAAKIDLDDVGQALGMTLTEVRVAAEPPAAPSDDVDDRQRTERDRSSDGPRGVGEPRATGREIANRIRGQVEKAFREGKWGSDFNPSMGFRRRFEQSLVSEGMSVERAASATATFYEKVDRFIRTAAEVGNEFTSANDFMSMVERHIDTQVESLTDAA
jgi:hypothetical protein